MSKQSILHQILLLIILAFLGGCNGIGTAMFEGGKATNKPSLPSSDLFFGGLNSIGNKTDTTLTLNWSTHPNALQYVLYNVTSGTPSLEQTILNPATNSVTLTGLTPNTTYKFRLRMIHDQGTIDDNKNDLTVVMNLAPEAPGTPSYNEPASSPGKNNRPTFSVSGVKTGDIVRLYKDDATCSTTAVASGTVSAGETSIDLQLSSALTVNGTYTFYADAANSASHRSNCSGGLSYELSQTTCPTGYILVSANASLGVNNDFCVAKYEMKCTGSLDGQSCSGQAVSKADGTPWVNITAVDSWNACLSLNSEGNNTDKLADTNNDGTYALISNPEWMTIARSVEDEASNWVSGILNRGWSASTTFGGDPYQHTSVAPQTNTNCLYSSAANTCASSGLHKFKRTHMLKNVEEIWDLTGNVLEWTDWSSSDSSFTLGPTSCDMGYVELNTVNCPALSSYDLYMPANSSSTSAQNIGRFFGGSGGAAFRGGGLSYGSLSGPYFLFLNMDDSYFGMAIGFRCVWRP